ncbi:MAG: menaquinone biosynthesis decarboxylase, partial [Rikenellaceae bacterium]
MYKNLNSYIKFLESKGELKRVKEFVSTDLEIAEITDRESKSEGGGKALLFENNETQFPVLTNMMGSIKRMEYALGVDSLEEPANRIYELFSSVTKEKNNFSDKLKMLPILASASRWLPKRSAKRGDCQEVVYEGDDVDLSMLPILKCAPLDGGRFVTLPLVGTRSAETDQPNLGMYRMQVFSKNTTGMHWHRHKTGERHYEEHKKQGKRMDVVVCLGGDPVYTYSAVAPLPEGIDEYLLAGFLRQKPVELVKALHSDIYVPSDCDFVIEGYVDTSADKVIEGPFGDHTGFYSLEDYYPTFHVTCITHRKDAVYPATLVGVPPMEDAYIAVATERLFLAPIRLVAQPDIVDMFMPFEGVAHNIVLMDIEKRYPYQGFKVAQSMWGAGQMMFNKFAVITSGLQGRMTDVSQIKSVIANIDVDRDLLVSRGPLDVLDHTSNVCGFGGKLCIDATVKLEEELVEFKGYGTVEYQKSESTAELLALGEWSTAFVKIARDKDYRQVAEEFVELNSSTNLKFVLLVDEFVDFGNLSVCVWYATSNVEPLRDLYIYKGVAVFDCRAKFGGLNGFKRRWPNVVTMDDKTIETVDKKWSSFGLGEFKSSPSLEFKAMV